MASLNIYPDELELPTLPDDDTKRDQDLWLMDEDLSDYSDRRNRGLYPYSSGVNNLSDGDDDPYVSKVGNKNDHDINRDRYPYPSDDEFSRGKGSLAPFQTSVKPKGRYKRPQKQLPEQSSQKGQKQLVNSKAHTESQVMEGEPIVELNTPGSLNYKLADASGSSYFPDFQDYEPESIGMPISNRRGRSNTSNFLNDASLKKRFASALFQFDPIGFWDLRDVAMKDLSAIRFLDAEYLARIERAKKPKALPTHWFSIINDDSTYSTNNINAATYRQSVHTLIQAGAPEFNALNEPKDVNATFIRAIKRCEDPGFRNRLVKRLEGLRLSSTEPTGPQPSEKPTVGGKANSPVGPSKELPPSDIIVEDRASFPKEPTVGNVRPKSLEEPVGPQVETLAKKPGNLEDYISAASNDGPSSGFKNSNTPNARDTNELEDSGASEEIDIKIKGLYILTQLLVLRKTEWGTQDKSHTSDLNVNSDIQRQSGKRKGSSDEDNEGDRNRRHPLKRIRRCDLRSLNGHYACPFAKGDPTAFLPCLLIGRKNLAGVKEHLKRNHCNKILPVEVRVAKSWDEVFDWCSPLWGDRPRPSPYLDIGTPWELISTVTDVGGMASFAVSLPKVKSTFLAEYLNIEDRSSEQNLRAESSSFFEIAATEGPKSPQVSDNEQGADEISETMVPTNALPTVLDHSRHSETTEHSPNLSLSVVDENLRTQNPIGAMFANLAAPQISWPPSAELEPQFNALPSYFYNEYGIDVNAQPMSLYSSLLDTFNLVSESPQVSFQANPDLPNAFRTPNTTPRSSSNNSSNSLNQSPPGIEENAGGSTETSLRSESVESDSKTGEKKYLLIVSRQPELPQSKEGQGYKCFNFESFGEFRQDFENWMRKVFTDPPFSWDGMELLNDLRKARMSSVEGVVQDLHASFIHYRTTEAALYLSVTAETSIFRWKIPERQRVHSHKPSLRTDRRVYATEIRGSDERADINGLASDDRSLPSATSDQAGTSLRSRCSKLTTLHPTSLIDIEEEEKQDIIMSNSETKMDGSPGSPSLGSGASDCKLLSLPSEIIYQILLQLPEISLYAISLTCRSLQTHSFTDSLWQNLLTPPDFSSPHPYLTYRALHHALSPHLYLRRKVFIGDRQFFGSILISKYMPMSGALEAFSLTVTPHDDSDPVPWSYDGEVEVHSFEPEINIRDEPELKISPNSKASEDGEIPVSRRGILATYFRAEAILENDAYAQMAVWPPRIIPSATRVRNQSSNGFRSGGAAKQRGPFMRLPSNISINGTSVSIGGFNDMVGAAVDRSAFIQAPSGSKDAQSGAMKWKVDEARRKSGYLSDKAFRLRRWAVLGDVTGDIEGRFRMGERVETFAELDEELWTPTKEYPYRGIWVGNYSPHPSEFVLFHQPATSGPQKRLEVIKLTGDPNVPRGEYTWIIDDLSQPVRIASEDETEWPGARVYSARAHIAEHEFRNDSFVDAQVILPCPERDWQGAMKARKKSQAGQSSNATEEKEEEERGDDVGEGWGVGSEERGSADGSQQRRTSARRKQKTYMDEPWVPQRVAVYWHALEESIMPFVRVDMDKILR
ncbi:hypothetical protein H072_3855 [Dactylellina haptotyla CBS 200.50]|uniref:F-box domain-containing protein n=1 Tax=Dactylellina haptotyla (strain CBS 200.50) TaxID=1284197 RepID=S8C321_DACHA|nr:hypothetical protein H072_3855 [Dactylellina haptotyla CBS 200.50]